MRRSRRRLGTRVLVLVVGGVLSFWKGLNAPSRRYR